MDNPNDFIHIDEVFRKLKDREEPEGTGSWMRMKDLLDKEMPVGSPVSTFSTLRRYMIPMMATLLIGSGLAYYGISKNGGKNVLEEDRTAAVTASNNSDAKMHNTPAVITHADHYGPVTPKAGPADLNSSSDKAQQANITENTNSKATDRHTSDSYAPHHYSGSKGKTDAGSLTPPITGNNNKTDNRIAGSNENKHPKPVMGGNKISGDKPTVASTNGKTQNTVAPVAKPFEEQNVVETLYPVSNGNKTTATKPTATANNNADMKVVAAHYNKDKIVKDENGSFFKEVRDTVKKIDMVQHTEMKDVRGNKTMQTVIDTLAITRVERIRYTPLAPLEIASLRKANIIPKAETVVPMARMKTITVANEMVNMVPLSDYKVASRKVDPSKFNQLVQNTSQGISNYFDGTNKFYAAILLGGNGFMGSPTAFGMQFGIAGLYQLSERLTLAGELKFANHYFSNYTINDQSVTFDNVSSQQSGLEWLFSGTKNITTSAYKINSFSALEFPVTLSYSLGRVSVFGGVNMSYAFPVKWDRSNSVTSESVSTNVSQNQNPFLNADFKLNEQKDFASRFGMGYVAGLSYDISRKLSFDARVAQNVWTNYNGNADAVNKLFKMPTFQFSIGYFFGRKERVAYILDK